MFESLLKAAVGVVVELPVAIVKDVVTLGGAITDGEKEQFYWDNPEAIPDKKGIK